MLGQSRARRERRSLSDFAGGFEGRGGVDPGCCHQSHTAQCCLGGGNRENLPGDSSVARRDEWPVMPPLVHRKQIGESLAVSREDAEPAGAGTVPAE